MNTVSIGTNAGKGPLPGIRARENRDYRRTSAPNEPAGAASIFKITRKCPVRPFASVLFAAGSEVAMHELNCHRAFAYR